MHYFKILAGSLVAVLFLLTNSLVSVIISVDKLTEINGKKVYILGDYHVPIESVDQQQRQDLVQFLQHNNTQEHTNVYVEDVTVNFKDTHSPSQFLNYLVSYLKDKQLAQVTIESLEKTPIHHTFHSMVSYDNCPNWDNYSTIFATDNYSSLPSILWTVKDLEREYDAYADNIKQLVQDIPDNVIAQALESLCTVSNQNYSKLLRDINYNLKQTPKDRLSLIAFKGYYEFVRNIRQQRGFEIEYPILDMYDSLKSIPDEHMTSLWQDFCQSTCSFFFDALHNRGNIALVPIEYRVMPVLLLKSIRALLTYYTIAKILSPTATDTTVICAGALHAVDIVKFLTTYAHYTHSIHASMYEDIWRGPIRNPETEVIPIKLSDYLI